MTLGERVAKLRAMLDACSTSEDAETIYRLAVQSEKDIDEELSARKPVGLVSDDIFAEYRAWRPRALHAKHAFVSIHRDAKIKMKRLRREENAIAAERGSVEESCANLCRLMYRLLKEDVYLTDQEMTVLNTAGDRLRARGISPQDTPFPWETLADRELNRQIHQGGKP